MIFEKIKKNPQLEFGLPKPNSNKTVPDP